MKIILGFLIAVVVTYILGALVWVQHKDDPARARALVQTGLGAGAEPTALLIHYSSILESSR